MAGDAVKEFYNVLGIEVDQASAAKAEAAMRSWKAAADDVAATLADVGGKAAGFLNALSGFSETMKLASDTANLSKPIKSWEKSILSLGQVMVEVGPWVDGFGAVLRQYGARAWTANKATDDIRLTLEELRGEVKRAQGGLEKVESGLRGVKESAVGVSAVNQQLAKSTRQVSTSHEGAVSKVTRYGDALRATREIISTAREAYQLLMGDMLEHARLTVTAAKTSGVSNQFYQEQAYALRTVGLEADELRDVFLDLSDKAYDASTGSKEQAATFQALGVKVTDTTGKLKPMEQLFLDVADGLKNQTNETKRTGLASKILGEQGARLLPILADGADGLREYAREAHEVGAVLSDEALQSATDYNRTSVRLTATLEGLRNTLGVALLPVLEKLAKRVAAFVQANKDILKTRAKQWVEGFAKALDGLLFVMNHWKVALLGAAAVLGGPYLAALSTVTAAQVTLGAEALIAGGKAAAGAVLAAGPWVALAALILLVTEDLYGFETGQDSAFGALYDWIHTFDPEDNPVVMFLKETMKGITDLVKASTDVLFDITNPEKWKAYLVALIKYLVPFSDQILRLFNPFSDVNDKGPPPADTGAATAQAQQMRERGKKRSALGGFFAGSYQDPEDAAAELAVLRGAPPAWASRYDSTAQALSASPEAFFGRAGTVEGAASGLPMQSGPGGPFAPIVNMNTTINAAPGQSPTAIGQAAATASSDKLGSQLRATVAAYKKG